MKKSFLPALLLMLAVAADAQEFRATISGHVYDQTGAAVPKARVEATNIATNETATATTDASGSYSIPALRPGQYNVTVTATGFKSTRRENLTLEVGRVVGVDVNLEVGEVTESVTVSAEGVALETQTASRVGVVTTTQVSELPLNSRNPFMLGSMMSGVNFRGAAIWQRPFDNGAIAEWSVNGGRQSNNEFLMDGAPNNAQMGSNNIAYVPPVDSVQEFSVQQNSYDAQYGKTGGGVFNVILKSGTNQHHGTVYEFMRRRWMDANTYQNKAANPPADRPDHRLDQYGIQLDGPIFIPGLLRKDGPIRLFYMGQYEGYYEKWPQFLNTSFPEPEMRRGDFSRLRTATGEPILIYDPIPVGYDAQGNPIRQPFPGNIIPENRISPVARALTQFMPAPNTTTLGERYSRSNLILPNYAATDDFYNLTLKFDWNFGDNHRAFIRHASNDRTEDRCDNAICEGPGMSGQQPFQRINDAYVLDWVSTLSPTTILNVRASHNRFIETGFGRGNVDFDLSTVGLPQSLLSQLPSPVMFGRWNFYDAIGGTNNQYTQMGRARDRNITNTYALMGNLTHIAGPHTMKFGLDVRRTHFIQQNTGNILQFDARPQWTSRLWNQIEPTSGDAFASFLLGGVQGSSNYPVFPFFRQWYFAPYFQDDWKVSRRLTLNLGLRWDINTFPDEKYNRINRGFNPLAPSPIAEQIPAAMLAMYPQLRNLQGGLEFAGVNGNSEQIGTIDWNNLQPRIGAAYQIADRTVLRGGYGLFFTNFANNNDWNRTNGFSTSTPLVSSLDEGRTLRPNVLTNPFDAINQPAGAGLGYNTFVGQDFSWWAPNARVPKVHQFSFGIQRQITEGSTLDVSYVGSRSIGLTDQREYNLPSAEFRRQCNLLEGGSPNFCNELLPNPFQGVEAFRGTSLYSQPTVSRFQLARPFPQFTGSLTVNGENTSRIWYNSLQINYNHRFSRGITLMGNYTLSKMVERWNYLDPYNDVPQRGLYFSDRPHFFKFNTVYELPFGRGRSIAGDAGGFWNKLISGWQFSTFTQIASGEPNNLPGNALMLKDPRTPGGNWSGDVNWNQHQIYGWNNCVLRQFNDGRVEPTGYSLAAGCGTDPANYAWLRVADYAPRRVNPERSGQIRKQPFFNMDAALAKNTQITERIRAQIRVEAFNLTNYYFFGRDSHFNTNPDDPNFGSIFPHLAWIGNGYPRQMQLAFRVLW